MSTSKSKTTAAIALFLISVFAISLIALPGASAQATYRTKKTYAVCGLMPNPAGVGDEVLIWVGITDYVENPTDGWVGLSITIERPDGKTDTIKDIKTDATGATGKTYVPDIVGNYTVQTHFPAQWFNWTYPPMFDPEVYGNIWYEASDSEKLTLVVTEEPLPVYPATPLPTEYWTRPINGQHWDWNTISANWISTPDNLYAANNDNAPESGHILWAKPLSLGGLAGGYTGTHAYEQGDAYEGKWGSSVILNGILFYNRFAQGFGGGWSQQGIYAVDLRTGEELWFKNNSRLAFGQQFYWDSFNMHGVFSYIYETVTILLTPNPFGPSKTVWKAYDPLTGEYEFSIENIPSGGVMFGPSNTVIGPNGEITIYNIDLVHGWIAKWNTTTAVLNGGPYGPATGMSLGSWGSAANTQYTFDGNQGYDWNKTLSAGAGNLPGSIAKILPDRVIGCTAAGWTSIGERTVGIWAFSLKPGQEGQLLYNTTWQPPAGMLTVSFGDASAEDKIFTLKLKEFRQIYGFSTETGQKAWGPTESQAMMQVYGMEGGIAYGRVFSTGYSGILYCYNASTGETLWEYKAEDPYHQSTYGIENSWPLFIAFIADNKVYLQSNEHSPINPLPRGSPFVCVDVETGKRVWELPIWGTAWGGAPIIGDSIIAQFDSYDNRIYSIGKGPSATKVTAPEIGVPAGSSVTIRGTVTDVSAGTKQDDLAARFPNGVPAVSDESMTEWMQYVYMQFPRPSNATGVEVTLDAVDPNNNFIHIGNTTSDSSGLFSYQWNPPSDIPGKYTIIATFAGSKSYWPSFAETAVSLDPAPEATPAPTPTPASVADLYFVPATAGMIVAIIAVGAVIVLMLRKRP